MFKADKCLRTPSVCLIVPIVVYFRWLWKPSLNRLWGCWFITFKWRMPLAQQFHTRYSIVSFLTFVHLCLLSRWLFKIIALIITEKGGVNDIPWSESDSLPSFSPSCFSFSRFVLLSSGFKRLSSSLVPRSHWPLPFICLPFDVVPA